MTSTTSARPRSRRPAAAVILLALAITALIIAGPAAATPRPGVSLTVMEPAFMCATCHEPLNVAQSPQAASERAYLGTLIANGETKAQIESAMVGAYGPTVLSEPKATGFNVVLYVLPPLLLLAGIASLAVLLPRWRRRADAAAGEAIPAGPALDTAGAKRLEDELARYDG